MNTKFPKLHPHLTRFSERQKRIHTFLRAHHTAVLSTVTPDNDPHGTVIYYTVDDDFTFYILTKTGTRKYDNMVHNDHVMLTIFDADSQAVAQVVGLAAECGDSHAVDEVAGMLFDPARRAGSDGLPPIVKLQAGPFTAFQIHPVQIRMANYGQPDSGDYNSMFESIESFDLRVTA